MFAPIIPKVQVTPRLLIFFIVCALGFAVGVGLYAFIYAKGYSYLANDPAACMNCHVMQDQYSSWVKSSHHAVAGCNDCHTPAGFVGKYMTKATNGFFHSVAFTSGIFHEPIQIKNRNRQIAEESCRKCHREFLESTDWALAHGDSKLSCVRCHGSVGHMR